MGTIARQSVAIGYMSLAFSRGRAKPVAINGIKPTKKNAISGKYPYVQSLNFLTKGTQKDVVRDFINFTLSKHASALLRDTILLYGRNNNNVSQKASWPLLGRFLNFEVCFIINLCLRQF